MNKQDFVNNIDLKHTNTLITISNDIGKMIEYNLSMIAVRQTNYTITVSKNVPVEYYNLSVPSYVTMKNMIIEQFQDFNPSVELKTSTSKDGDKDLYFITCIFKFSL